VWRSPIVSRSPSSSCQCVYLMQAYQLIIKLIHFLASPELGPLNLLQLLLPSSKAFSFCTLLTYNLSLLRIFLPHLPLPPQIPICCRKAPEHEAQKEHVSLVSYPLAEPYCPHHHCSPHSQPPKVAASLCLAYKQSRAPFRSLGQARKFFSRLHVYAWFGLEVHCCVQQYHIVSNSIKGSNSRSQ
jgi:hypothetical protein